MKKSTKIFNRARLLKNKASCFLNPNPDPFLLNQRSAFYSPSVDNLIHQLSSIRKTFSNIVLISSSPELFLTQLPLNCQPENLFICDTSPESLEFGLGKVKKIEDLITKYPKCKVFPLVIEEELWCFKPESLDLIISHHHLHWVNDLQVAFLRMLDSLKPDGAFIGSVFGSDTLEELRICLTLSESERSGGISQHISPFISIIELGNLLARCNYNLPTIFTERRMLYFESCLHLMQFLRNLGENNALINVRTPFSVLETLYSVMAIYDQMFEYVLSETNDKMVCSTFEEVYFLGWKYHESQQKPKKRGSAEFSLKDLHKEMKEIDQETKIEYGELHEEEDKEKNDKKT